MHEANADPTTVEPEKRTFFSQYSQYPKSRLTLALMFTLLLIVGISWGTVQSLTASKIGELPSRTFTVSGPPTLVIKADAGQIFVRGRPGDTNKVFIFGYKNASGFGGYLDDIGQQITQRGNTLNMTWTMKPRGFGWGSESVDLFIDIPANGKATIETDTSTADINMDGIEGQMTLKTQSGHVSIWGTMQGQSLVQTTSGAIDYCGTLDPLSRNSFQTTTGKITVTLPSTITFHLQMSNEGGKSSNDFGSNDVGAPPQATLQVTTKRGSIAIHDGGVQLPSCA